jgi:hypothetical protein
MGLAGLTAVFGMGTGGAPPVSSPESGRGAVRPPSAVGGSGWSVTRAAGERAGGGGVFIRDAGPMDRGRRPMDLTGPADAATLVEAAADRGGQAARLLGPVGCGGRPPCTPGLSTWSSPRSLRTPTGTGNLVLKRASRLDAFSAYPFPTWLPGDAPSGTAGTPEVGPPQSSRTRGDPSQVSCAHGR